MMQSPGNAEILWRFGVDAALARDRPPACKASYPAGRGGTGRHEPAGRSTNAASELLEVLSAVSPRRSTFHGPETALTSGC
jgi:hypothetical protein